MQMLKSQGNPKAPRDIAQEIVSNLKFSEPFIESVSMMFYFLAAVSVMCQEVRQK